jgi:hypothetical protein
MPVREAKSGGFISKVLGKDVVIPKEIGLI